MNKDIGDKEVSLYNNLFDQKRVWVKQSMNYNEVNGQYI